MKTDEQITDSDAPANLNSEEASAWACGYRSGYSAAHALQAQQVTATDKARIIDIVDRVIGEFPHPVPYRLDLAALITSALSRVPQPEPGKDRERLDWCAKMQVQFGLEQGASGYPDRWIVYQKQRWDLPLGEGPTYRSAIDKAMEGTK
jgi:hypothetical protein